MKRLLVLAFAVATPSILACDANSPEEPSLATSQLAVTGEPEASTGTTPSKNEQFMAALNNHAAASPDFAAALSTSMVGEPDGPRVGAPLVDPEAGTGCRQDAPGIVVPDPTGTKIVEAKFHSDVSFRTWLKSRPKGTSLASATSADPTLSGNPDEAESVRPNGVTFGPFKY